MNKRIKKKRKKQCKDALVAIIRFIYFVNCAGGELHIVLDDFNVDNSTIVWCKSNLEHGNYYKLYRKCCDLLLMLTEQERKDIIKKANGYLYYCYWRS